MFDFDQKFKKNDQFLHENRKVPRPLRFANPALLIVFIIYNVSYQKYVILLLKR